MSWYAYFAYGIRLGWVPESERKPELIECKPYTSNGLWVCCNPVSDRIAVLYAAACIIGFRGYRYGKELLNMLRQYSTAGGRWITEIPDAVVFDRAEVEAVQHGKTI